MTIVYEDNHIIIVNKEPGEIVQGDKTGDEPLSEKVKAYIKERYAKPGAVFLGVVHRLDRPVSGLVVFARTSKALSRLNEMFRKGEVSKTYHAIVPLPSAMGRIRPASLLQEVAHLGPENLRLTHFLTRNERQNRSYAHRKEVAGSKKAVLDVRSLACGDRYELVAVNLLTGRHHQIRCQLAAIGRPIKGDLKYGFPRSNPDGSISLHAYHVEFEHPVSHVRVSVTAPHPAFPIWSKLAGAADGRPLPDSPEQQ